MDWFSLLSAGFAERHSLIVDLRQQLEKECERNRWSEERLSEENALLQHKLKMLTAMNQEHLAYVDSLIKVHARNAAVAEHGMLNAK
jgi:hypothetical protein